MFHIMKIAADYLSASIYCRFLWESHEITWEKLFIIIKVLNI